MTNFQQDNAQNRFAWLTPERALVVLPAAVGVTFALILAGALVVRFQSTINELTALEQERLQKRDDLSFAKIQQRKLKQTYREAQEQTQLLQQLVAGNQSIETLLSQLNLEASESNVVLESYEPKRTQAAPAGSGNSKKNAPPVDPLVTDGVIKEKRLIVVKGPYVGLLEFLRRLERITPLLVISDLSMQADTASSSDDQPLPQPTSTMRLTLTAYSKEQGKAKQQPDAEPLAPS